MHGALLKFLRLHPTGFGLQELNLDSMVHGKARINSCVNGDVYDQGLTVHEDLFVSLKLSVLCWSDVVVGVLVPKVV